MKIISMLRCNLKHLILLLSVFHHKVHLITLVFYGFQLDIEQWGYKAGNNAKWTYPLALSTLLYVDVSGDANGPDESVSYSKESFITYADLTHLWFITDTAAGCNRFLVLGM